MRKLLPFLLMLLALPASADPALGRRGRPTYTASTGAAACDAANVLAVESTATTGIKILRWCVNMSQATAAAAVNITLVRTTAASSGGTALTAEGTGTTAVSKMDPADANYGGVARGGAATITAGARLDQAGFSIGEIGAGTADPASPNNFCKTYGSGTAEKLPTAALGVANGIALTMSASGAGSLSSCAMSVTFIAE